MALGICLPSIVLCAIRIFLIPEINDAETEKKDKEKLTVKESVKMVFTNNYLMFFTLALLLTNIAQTLMTNTQTYYFKYVIGDIQKMTIVAAVAIVGPLTIAAFPALSKKMGLRNLMALGLVLGAIGRFIPLVRKIDMRMPKKFVRYSDGAKMYSMGITKFQEVAKDAKSYKVI